jgi:hypothetical protein
MTSSTRCSTRHRAILALAAVAAAATASGCGHPGRPVRRLGPVEPGARPRVAVLPVDNLSGAPAPAKELLAVMEGALRGKVDVVGAADLEDFLGRHRLRYTGGIDAESARAARDELGANAVLLTSVTVYRASGPPALGITARLVSTGDEPEILWMDAAAWAGDQAPGLLGMGRRERMAPVQARVVRQLARSLDAFLDGKTRDVGCGGDRYRPKVRFRSSELDTDEHHTVAVVPFLDHSKRRGAGEALALEFVRQLVANGRYRVLEPGVVRDYLLSARVLVPGGISLETTRMILGGLGADMVMSGVVLDFDEGARGGSAIRFRAVLLDSEGDVLWSSSSFNRSDEGVVAFGLGRVGNSQELTCRMVTGVVARLARPGATPVAWARPEESDPRKFMGSSHDERAGRKAGSAGR